MSPPKRERRPEGRRSIVTTTTTTSTADQSNRHGDGSTVVGVLEARIRLACATAIVAGYGDRGAAVVLLDQVAELLDAVTM